MLKTLGTLLVVLVIAVFAGCKAQQQINDEITSLLEFAPDASTEGLRQVVQTGHSNRVSSIAFSPDDCLILSGSWDKTLKLWNTTTGKELRTFTGHSGWIHSVAFSPDGRFALSGSDETMKLWEVATGLELRTFTGHSGWVMSVAFSPDGRFALSGSADNTLKLWEVATGTELRTFSGHSGRVQSVAFFPDGRFTLSGSADKTLKLWEVATGTELRTFIGHSDQVTSSVAFSPDGRFALSGSADKTMKLWEVSTGTELRTFSGHSNRVKSVAFSPDGRFVLSGSLDKTIKLWEVATGKNLFTFIDHSTYGLGTEILSVAFSHDGQLVLSGVLNHLKLWQVSTRTELRTFSGHSSPIRSLAFSRGDHIAFVTHTDVFNKSNSEIGITVWDVTTGKELYRFYDPSCSTTLSAAISPNSRIALSGCLVLSGCLALSRCDFNSAKYVMTLWDVATGKKLRTFSEHYVTSSIAFSHDGHLAIGGGINSNNTAIMVLWDVATGKELRTFIGHSNLVMSVAFSHDDRLALSGGTDKTIKLWNVATGKELHTFRGHPGVVNSVDFSPDDRFCLSASYNEKSPNNDIIKLWDIATGKELRTFGNGSQKSVVFSPNGRLALSGDGDLWDLATGVKLKTFGDAKGYAGITTGVAFSTDGRRIISGDVNGLISVWDVDSWQRIVSMISATDGEWSIYTPDGYYNTSLEGKSAVYYVAGLETYGFEQFESLFRRPDIIQARLAGNLKAGTPAPKLTRPPRVTLVSTRNLTPTTDKATYPLAITATSHDDLVQTVRVFVNGKPALEKPVNAKEQRLDFQVPLFAGPNRITTVAYDRKGFSSNQASIDIISTVPGAKKPTLFVMAVGISQYPKMRKGDQLDYAHTDAQNLVKILRQQKGQLFADVRDFTLINQEATPRAITDGLHALSAMDANDIAIIFFAGHGVQSKDGRFWYLTQEGSFKQPESGGLDWQTLNEHFNRIKGRVILFLDACHSGSITDETIVPNDQLAAKFFKGGMGGVMVFSASKGRQKSDESKDLAGGYGYFTYGLTQGLGSKSKEADRDNNGFVEFMELVDYVSKVVSDETAGQQTPWLSRRELFGDLAIAKVK